MIREVEDFNWQELVGRLERPKFVEFWADWCGPCKFMAPEVESLAEKYGDKIDFLKMDTDVNQLYTAMYGVMSIPHVLFFASPDGPPRRLAGFQKAEVIEEALGLAQAIA